MAGSDQPAELPRSTPALIAATPMATMAAPAKSIRREAVGSRDSGTYRHVASAASVLNGTSSQKIHR